VKPQVNTVTETVTSPSSSKAATTKPKTPAADSRTPTQLSNAGYARLLAGDAAGALPLLERAVAALRGTGSLSEAYASYNLAWARFDVGRCDGVLDLLDRSEAVQGHRKEIDRLRKQAEKSCRPGGQGRHED
jgi:hypothetical protein